MTTSAAATGRAAAARRRACVPFCAAIACALVVAGFVSNAAADATRPDATRPHDSLVAAAPRIAEDSPQKPKRSVEAVDVYFGDASSEWSKPAEVDADLVFAQIAEYKQIVDENIESTDPKYDILLSKATRRFTNAVRAAAKDGAYDIVAKVGAVKGVESVPAITQAVIAKL